MRLRARVDRNQKSIVTVLRQLGATVQSLSPIGSGCPDILAGYLGKNVLMEIKDGSLPPSERRLTPDEAKWISLWRGQVVIVESIEEACAAIGVNIA